MLENENTTNKRKNLGRGLSALLGEDTFEPGENKSTQSTNLVNIDLITPSKFQPRTEFNAEAMEDLCFSIREKGILQPLLVRKQGDGYELIAGERRLRAAKMLYWKEVPVIEKQLSDKEVLEVALVENLIRENLSVMDEAEGYSRLMEEFGYTQDYVSKAVGKSRPYVANILRLLTLPESVRNMIKENKLSTGHARALIGLENAEELAKKIIEQNLNVRAVEELANKEKNPAKKAAKKKAIKDEDLAEIEKALVKSLGLRLKISPSRQGGGKVVLQYASAAELDMIVEILEHRKNNTSNTVFKAEAPVNSNNKFTMKVVG